LKLISSKYLFLTSTIHPQVIMFMKHLHLNNHHPTTWWSCLHSSRRLLTWLHFEKFAPSWCCNLFTPLLPLPFQDVPRVPLHLYNHDHHSSLKKKKEGPIIVFSFLSASKRCHYYCPALALISRNHWEAFPPLSVPPYLTWLTSFKKG
jgi:hypothetical protein